MFFFFNFCFFIKVELIYNVVMIYAIQQSDPGIYLQWVKNLVLLQLWHRLQLQLRFDPCWEFPSTCHGYAKKRWEGKNIDFKSKCFCEK